MKKRKKVGYGYVGDVGPFHFLFCESCNKHLSEYPSMRLDVLGMGERTEQEKAQRVSPGIKITMRPHCPDCGSKCIQKYVTITVTVPSE